MAHHPSERPAGWIRYRHPTDPGSSRLGQQRAARDHDPLRGQLCRRHQQVDLGPGALGLHHIASRQPAA